MACPKDFNSVETDKLVCSALAYAALASRSRKTSPKVRAGGMPFGSGGWLLPRKQAITILRVCLQQVSRMFAHFLVYVIDPGIQADCPACAIFFTLLGLILQPAL
jgi:hypothetical protein